MKSFLLLTGALSLAALLPAQITTGYYRYPAIRGNTVVFTAEGDLWRVPTTGGTAQRLTSHPGQETNAAISPDGKWVAFSAQYEGPTDVYVMPIDGGLPKRLTFVGDAHAYGWTPDGRVLYATRTLATLPDVRLAAVDPQTLDQTNIPLAQASEGGYDDSGTLYFTRRSAGYGRYTKRYEGGANQNLWALPAKGPAVALTADYDGTSKAPHWSNGRLYFLTDRDGTLNLWSMKPDGSDRQQHTHHKDFGLRSFAIDGHQAVYQNGADLWLYDTASGQDAIIPIKLASDFDQTRETRVEKPLDYLSGLALSPNGDRVALTGRGQVFVAPVEPRRLIEAARPAGVRYREAAFTPDGKSLVTLSDESGEVEFWRLPANGVGAREQLTKDGVNLRLRSALSPDGKWLAYSEHRQYLFVRDLATGQVRQVGHSPAGDFMEPDFAWAPDSQWLAYSLSGERGEYSRIFIYSLADGKNTAVTTNRAPSFQPRWSPDGKWLYFLTERHLESAVGSPWGNRAPQPYFDKTALIYQLALSPETRSPFEPANELAAPEADKPAEAKDEKKPDATAKPAAVKVTIDFNGLDRRQWQLPVPAGNYTNLVVTDKYVLALDVPAGPGSEDGARPTGKLVSFEIKDRDVEPVTVLDAVSQFVVSADRKKLALVKDNNLYVFDAGPPPAKLEKAKVDLTGLAVSYQPRENWREIFVDSWRMHRDYFYDPAMHGVDWKAGLAKHLPLVDRVSDREELTDLIIYMMSELSALHSFVFGGDLRHGPENIAVGSLGAELARDPAAGGWRITRIYHGDPDYPAGLSPLQKPGMHVAEGDVILAINGTATLSVPHPAALLRGKAGQQVLLQLKPAPGAAPYDLIVRPQSAGDFENLRYTDWELSRRQAVEQAAAGQIGYVHLRAMGAGDEAQWARDFFPVVGRDGLILDLRHNNGGNIDSWVLGSLLRKAWMYWTSREGAANWNMQGAFRGHVVVLIDGETASDGEAAANGFRRLGLGKLIGTRTWGGGIWLSMQNQTVDRGVAAAGEFGSYGPEGAWLVEGRGISPDIVVDNPPDVAFRGQDPQLEAAIKHLQELIAKDPRPVPAPPAFPVKTRP